MPTILSHPAVPLALALGLGRRAIPPRLLVAGTVCSILPDLDVLGFGFGIAYASPFGHRGVSHSLFLAVLVALAGAVFHTRFETRGVVVFLFLFVAMASHGLLDALTNGGLGIALLWPFSDDRYFAPFQVIEVSPIGLSRFLQGSGLQVLLSEAIWVWAPCAIAALALAGVRVARRRRS